MGARNLRSFERKLDKFDKIGKFNLILKRALLSQTSYYVVLMKPLRRKVNDYLKRDGSDLNIEVT